MRQKRQRRRKAGTEIIEAGRPGAVRQGGSKARGQNYKDGRVTAVSEYSYGGELSYRVMGHHVYIYMYMYDPSYMVMSHHIESWSNTYSFDPSCMVAFHHQMLIWSIIHTYKPIIYISMVYHTELSPTTYIFVRSTIYSYSPPYIVAPRHISSHDPPTPPPLRPQNFWAINFKCRGLQLEPASLLLQRPL